MTNNHTQTLLDFAGTLDWQDIETAPKDGTGFICYGGNLGQRCCGTAKWNNDVNDVDTLGGQPMLSITHWMPLPTGNAGAVIRELVDGITATLNDVEDIEVYQYNLRYILAKATALVGGKE